MIRWRARGLDQKDILAADILLDLDESFPVRKRFDRGFPQLGANISADGLSQRTVGRTAENLHKATILSLKAKPTGWRRKKQTDSSSELVGCKPNSQR